MLLRRLKLTNYGGIYNGMGLYEIEIDFTKCKHRLILIKGDNGTGKSTIETALKPLPDDNSMFISGKSASKEIEYFDEYSNIIYSIQFIHECKPNGTRNTKGYIQKTVNGITSELNQSGNITSCKDVIYEELQLDPNYITLTQLSATKRGIADMRPADRKRYVNSILSNTEVYNDMHKKLSKKSSGYKAMMNSIISKLDSIGNIAQVTQNLNNINEQIKKAEDMIVQYSDVRSKESGMLASIDPGNVIATKIEQLSNAKDSYSSELKKFNRELEKYPRYSFLSLDEIKQKIESEQIKYDDICNTIISLKSKIDILLETRQTEADELQAKSSKLQSINSDGSLEEVESIKNKLKSRKIEIEKRWGQIIDLNNITRDEFLSAYDILQTIIDKMAVGINLVDPDSIDGSIVNLKIRLNNIDDEIESIISDRNLEDSIEDKIAILQNRPLDCTNDNCPFIADALKSKAMLSKIRKHQNTLSQCNEEKNAIQDEISNLEANRQIITLYNTNSKLLSKFSNIGFGSYTDLMNMIKNRTFKKSMDTILGLIEYANDLEEYRTIEKDILEIEVKYNSLSSQNDFINMLISDINRLTNQLNEDDKNITTINNKISDLGLNKTNMEVNLESLKRVFELKESILECDDAIRILNEEIDSHKSEADKINKLTSDIEKLSVDIDELQEQVKPLKKERDSLDYKLTISMEYSKELEEYKAMYSKIETLKYYSSPTTGIQLLFANMYLSKIMDNANAILQNLFNGQFALLPLVITESEFKIPVAVNGGINHDDITSMSSAQISLISMIISISLLSQTSTRLNIIVGDEIDAPFDSENRREFINILYQLMSLVKSSQCVLISHNSEIPASNCDIILLKSENDIITEGNIIWSYR